MTRAYDQTVNADRLPAGRSKLPLARPPRTVLAKRLSILAMALGYLGLVAILSMAPFWHQTVFSHQNQPMISTEFGGSR